MDCEMVAVEPNGERDSLARVSVVSQTQGCWAGVVGWKGGLWDGCVGGVGSLSSLGERGRERGPLSASRAVIFALIYES